MKSERKFQIFLNSKIIFLVLILLCQKSSSNSTQIISQAISDVIFEFYIAQKIKFDFIIYGENSNHINDVVCKTIKSVNNKIPINIIHVKNVTNWNHKFSQSAVIFVKSLENLKILNDKSKTKNFQTPLIEYSGFEKLKFLIYYEDFKAVSDFFQVFTDNDPGWIGSYGELSFFEYFMFHDDDVIALTASEMFNAKACGSRAFKPLNYMSFSTQNWNENLTNFDFFNDFNGCMLSFWIELDFCFYFIASSIGNKYQVLDKYLTDKDEEIGGLIYELINVMAKRNNFTPQYIFEQYTLIRPARNYLPSFKHILKIIFTPLSMQNNTQIQFPFPIYDTKFYYLVSYNDLYTNYEKLIFPFDLSTWFLLFSTFALTFGSIFGLEFCPRWFKTLIIGKGINRPGYNALGIFFGISQLKLPKESFCRSILIMYLWFCLIIRTCWQSKMFEFMTSDMRKPLPASLEDLKEMNYTVCLDDLKMELFEEQLNGRESPNYIKLGSGACIEIYKEILLENDTSKYAFFLNVIEHAFWNSTLNVSLPIMENEILEKLIGTKMPKNHILLHSLIEVVNHLVPSGIIEHLIDYGLWHTYRAVEIEIKDQKRILSLNDLEFGFVIFLGSLSLPIFVFICELHALYVKRQFRKLLGLYEFLRVVREKLRDYHDRW